MKKALFLFVIVAGLAGCTSAGDQETASCPRMGLLRDADKILYFKDDTAQAVVATGGLVNFSGGCTVTKNGKIVYTLNLDFAAERAVGETGKKLELPYFIAVLSPDEAVLQRQRFSTTISFDENGHGLSTEEHELKIPGSDLSAASRYEITAGFELTPAQLEANRSKK